MNYVTDIDFRNMSQIDGLVSTNGTNDFQAPEGRIGVIRMCGQYRKKG